MKILLTGGSSFLGKNFIEAYKNKHTIIAPKKDEMNLLKFEEINAFFKQNKFDAVLHLASRPDFATELKMENLLLFKNVQYAAILYGVKKMVVVTDMGDLDRSRALENITETMAEKNIPTDSYGIGKYLIHLLAKKDKITTVLRCGKVFGKYVDCGESEAMEIFARGVTGKKKLDLPLDKEFSAVFSEDLIKIMDEFLVKDIMKGTYNVAGYNTSLTEIAKRVKLLSKKNERIVEFNFLSDKKEILTLNTEKLTSVLPNFKFTPLSSAMTKTFDHLNSHKAQAKPKERN